MSPPFTIVEVTSHTRRYRRLFLELPFGLYRDTPQWVPPLAMDARCIFDARHSFYERGEALFLLALAPDDRPLGRLAVLDNHSYNQFNHEKTAFFYLFECEDDPSVSLGLFEQGFAWARSRGLDRMIGPKGFTPLDGLGLLVRGFEHRPAFGLPYNLSYYPSLIEAAGFVPLGDEILSGYLSARQAVFPEKIKQVAEAVQKRRGMSILRFRSRRELAGIIPRFMELYNNSLEGTTGNYPLSQADIKALSDQLLWFANPRLIKIIMKDGEPVGYLLAYPDISAALQRCKGRLFPLGWLQLLVEMKRTPWVNVNGAAILEKYRGLGGTALLFNEMYESIRAGKFEHADIVQIGADNERMLLELRNLGIDFYKTHRLYQRDA